jgi:hypothetical protein
MPPRLLAALRAGKTGEAEALMARCRSLVPALAGYYGKLASRFPKAA